MITLYKSYKYDNSYKYIKTFSTKTEQEQYFNSLDSLVINETEYVKDNETIVLEYDCDYLTYEGYNYLSFNNGYKTIYAFITQKEYVRKNLTKIYFEVDVIQTFLFDFTINKSFITRKVCTIDEITEYDEGIEFGEHEVKTGQTLIEKKDTYFAIFSGFKDFFPKEDNTYEEYAMTVDKPITYIDGVPYPCLFYPMDEEGNDVIFKKLSNLPNLVGIIRFTNVTYDTFLMSVPFITVTDNRFMRTETVGKFAQNITSTVKESTAITIPKSTIFDFYPYTYYMLTDEECEPEILKPQYLNDSITVKGIASASISPTERYYVTGYKRSTKGVLYYIENNSISMLPVGTNGGIETITSNFSSMQHANNTQILGAISTGITGASQLFTGDVVGGIETITTGVNNVLTHIARQNDITLTPNTVKSFGTPNTRKNLGTKFVKLYRYSIQDKYKAKIQAYIDKYGNKFNSYATIDIKTYKGYIQFVDIDIDTNIDNRFTQKLIQIFEGGVHVE